VQVVEREQERPARGEVRRQPVEAVERRQRRVRGRLRRDLGRVKERRRERRRAREQVGSLFRLQGGEQRLEELPHYPVRERALKVGGAPAQHLHTGLLSECFRLHHQGGLADAGRPLDCEQPPAARAGGDQAGHRGQLGVALEQVELNREWLLGQLLASSFVTDGHRVRLLQRSFLNSDCTGLTKSRASVAQPPPR
jgi:hypothetical protein